MTSAQILDQVQNNLSASGDRDYFSIHVHRYRFILDQIRKFFQNPAKIKALDVGCYPPHLFSSLKLMGFDVYGISSAHESVKSPNIKTANLETDCLPFEDDSFELIVFTEVIEHLINHPGHVLRELHRLLKPGGRLIITTPNVSRTQNIIRLLTLKNVYFPLGQMENTTHLNNSIYHRHNREYTLSELKDLCQSLNYYTVYSSYFISYSPLRAKNQSDPMPLKLVKYFNFITMYLLKPYRDSLLLVLTK